jgi:hypothetical protein
VLQRVESYLRDTGYLTEVLYKATERSVFRWNDSEESLQIEFVDAKDIHGYNIGGGQTWVTCRARWNVSFRGQTERHYYGDSDNTIELWSVSFQVESTLLFKASPHKIEDVEVLSTGWPAQVVGQLERTS